MTKAHRSQSVLQAIARFAKFEDRVAWQTANALRCISKTLRRQAYGISKTLGRWADRISPSEADSGPVDKPFDKPEWLKEHDLDVLRMRYEDQVALIQKFTDIDLKIVTGYITLQMALGAWLSSWPIAADWSRRGMFVLDLTLASVAVVLLWASRRRRDEVVQTIRNINSALGLDAKGVYLLHKSINPKYKYRRWFGPYLAIIGVGVTGIAIILWSR
jgi:hypothetical protein